MLCGEKPQRFTYWKRPWQKWLTLAAGIFQVIILFSNVREYKNVLKAQILSASALRNYVIEQSFLCVLNGFTAAMFFAVFLIGVLVQSRKTARTAESIFLLASAVGWGIVGFVFPITADSNIKTVWSLIFLLIFGGGAYSFFKTKNT